MMCNLDEDKNSKHSLYRDLNRYQNLEKTFTKSKPKPLKYKYII